MLAMRTVGIALTAAPLVAQAGTGDISIVDANVACDIKFNTTAVTYAAATGADWFNADPSGTDSIFTTVWSIGCSGANSPAYEVPLHKGSVQQPAPTFSPPGAPAAVADWTDVGGWGEYSVSLVYSATSTGSNTGYVTAICTINNLTANPLTFNVFHMADPDLCGTFVTNVISPGGNGDQVVSNANCNLKFTHRAVNSDRWEVGSYTGQPGSGPDLFVQMEDTTATTLRNDATPYGPNDIRGCFQWEDRIIAGGGSDAFLIEFVQEEFCTNPVNAVWSRSTACPASTNGPVIDAVGFPRFGTTFTIRGSAAQGQLCALVLGVEAPPIPLSLLGFTEPGANYCMTLRASVPCSGATPSVDLSIGTDGSLCGFQLDAQWLDFIGAPAGFVTSAVLNATVGL